MRSTYSEFADGVLLLVASVGAVVAIGTQPVQAAVDACEAYKVVNGFVPHETFDPYPAAECTKLIRASGPRVILGIDVTGTTLHFAGISSNEPAGLAGAIYYVDNPNIHDVSVVLARDYRFPSGIAYRGVTTVEADATLPNPGIRYGPGASGEWIASWIAPAGAYSVLVRPSSPLTLDQVISRLIVLPPAPPSAGNSFPFSGQPGRWRPLGLTSLTLLSAVCVVAGVLKLRHHGRFRAIVRTWRLPLGVSGVVWWRLPASEVVVGALGGMALLVPELRPAASLAVLVLFVSLFFGQGRLWSQLPCCEVRPCWGWPC